VSKRVQGIVLEPEVVEMYILSGPEIEATKRGRLRVATCQTSCHSGAIECSGRWCIESVISQKNTSGNANQKVRPLSTVQQLPSRSKIDARDRVEPPLIGLPGLAAYQSNTVVLYSVATNVSGGENAVRNVKIFTAEPSLPVDAVSPALIRLSAFALRLWRMLSYSCSGNVSSGHRVGDGILQTSGQVRELQYHNRTFTVQPLL